ncbi:MAG: TIGR03790 family protein [Aquabacterium sp.]|uniref:TIGR03790 family protein n=1 Tax=Aquabacterium sp. TaxID=1872578 RepID=UPI001DBA023A|nr:TIGR03790 family protein [Aquabacterium sp.]MBT9609742.1 TIGR03790 family protein [Aquabacterium sp.]
MILIFWGKWVGVLFLFLVTSTLCDSVLAAEICGAAGFVKTTINSLSRSVYVVKADKQLVPVVRPNTYPAQVNDYRGNLPVPCVSGKLGVADVGVVINTNDPYSVAVGDYYVQKRAIPSNNVLKIAIPVVYELNPAQLNVIRGQIDAFFGNRVQALALVWRSPFAVSDNGGANPIAYSGCNASITSAVTFGYRVPCSIGVEDWSDRFGNYFGYFNSSSGSPYKDFGIRISMLLAARTVEAARSLIDRGVLADGYMKSHASDTAQLHFLQTSDSVRSKRRSMYPSVGGGVRGVPLNINIDKFDFLQGASSVMWYATGTPVVANLSTNSFLPGAIGDNLTSSGGLMDLNSSPAAVGYQTNGFDWVDAGVTAMYGTTSEPLAFSEKFPNPNVLYGMYVQGVTLIEALWKSVQYPIQGLFVGEPLASPFE